jgi:SpoVK/Ycf46/Vps4 family AAA+-type ATPase
LAILGGAKETPNLKIFASTNLRENMDSAFLRRMEIQLFLGNPSAQARLKWIKIKS